MDPSTPLGEAQGWLRDRVEHGEKCPCCQQFAKVYRRKLNSGIAHALIRMYRAGKTDWIHKPTVLRGVGAAARDESISRYWSLTEEETSVRRDDGGRAGYWRITGLGERFVLAAVRVPKYAHIYDGSCLRLSGDPVSIVDCLGDRFNYRELMGM